MLALLAILAALLAIDVAAAAATTVVDKSPDGSTLQIEAGQGDRNRLDLFTEDVEGDPALEFVVRESSRRFQEPVEIVAGDASCEPGPTETTVHCTTQGVTEIVATLGGRRDTFGAETDDLSSLGVTGVKAHGGGQRDVLGTFVNSVAPSAAPGFHYVGGLGDDVLIGSQGPDLLRGGAGADSFLGWEGEDRVRAADGVADGHIDCGAGMDRLAHDPGLDPEPTDCE